ncbi:MAG: hypothetical protein ACI3ZO_01365 [Candidatus Cryptobacteroides sp.]
MKSINIMSLALLCAIAAGCAKDNAAPENSVGHSTGSITGIIPSTRTSLDMSMDVVWNSGDRIMLFSPECPGGQAYVTESSQTKEGAFNSEGESTPGTKRYAVYPASAVEGATLSGETVKVDFSAAAVQGFAGALDANADISILPMTACSGNDKFAFKNLFGGIKLQMVDYQDLGIMVKKVEITSLDGLQIAGKADVNLVDGTFTLAADGGASSIVLDLGAGVSIASGGSFESVADFIAFIPAGTYSKGFRFTITDTEGRIYKKEMASAITVEPGFVTPLKAVPLSLYYGKANCCQTAVSGTVDIDITPYYTFSPDFIYENIKVEGNTSLAKSAKVIWQHPVSGESGDVVGTPSIKDNLLQVPVKGLKGNALVGICDASGNVLWSYHIWVSEINDLKYTNETAGDFTMMDRALGAVSVTLKDQNSYGYFYQWGRKDPFPRPVPLTRPTSDDKYKNADVELTANTASTAETGTIGYAVSHPDTRILDAKSWYFGGTPAGLWGNSKGTYEGGKGVKTIYDPCPEGYRVADPMCYSMGWQFDKDYCNANYGYNFIVDGGSVTSAYPTNGFLSANGNAVEYLEYRGYLWTNAFGDTGGVRFYYNNASIKNTDQNVPSIGMAVRCIKEQ